MEAWKRLPRRLLKRSCQVGDKDLLFFPPSFFLPRIWNMISEPLAALLDCEGTCAKWKPKLG